MNERERFLHDYNVPRGTALLFDRYAALLIDWQTRMNLVAPSTISQLWQRHFADSAQLIGLADEPKSSWLDMGAGAGFPGIVVAILSRHRVTLAESIAKKCRFLHVLVDELPLSNVVVLNQRVESIQKAEFDVLSARACSPLATLFELGSSCAHCKTQWLLPKGASVEGEVSEARHSFSFDAELIPSRTDQRGRIVVATNVHRKLKRG